MSNPPGFRRIEVQDSCANCVFLGWGKEQGWDKCRKHDKGIYWPHKKIHICDDHERSELDDPRNG